MKSPAACRNLTDIRAAVNAIDRDLVRLLAKRQKYALAALRFKRDRKSIGDPRHRRKMFAQRKAWAAPGNSRICSGRVTKPHSSLSVPSRSRNIAGWNMASLPLAC